MPPDKPTSPGLQRFHELCVAPAPAEAVNGTWYKHRDWVLANVPQEQILALYVMLWGELGPISQAEDDTPGGRLAGVLRDTADILWYAMSEETIARFEANHPKGQAVDEANKGENLA